MKFTEDGQPNLPNYVPNLIRTLCLSRIRDNKYRGEAIDYCTSRLYFKVRSKEVPNEAVSSYLYSTVNNLINDFLRLVKRHNSQGKLMSECRPSELLEMTYTIHQQVEQRVLLEEFVTGLAGEEKVLVQSLVRGVPYSKLAADMGLNINTLRTRIHRCRIRWNEIFEG